MKTLIVCLILGFSSLVLALPWNSILVYFNQADDFPQPAAANNNGYFSWANCLDKSDDFQPGGPTGSTVLPAKCQPDTLYNWGGLERLKELNDQAGAGKAWAPLFEMQIYTHINPAATFAY